MFDAVFAPPLTAVRDAAGLIEFSLNKQFSVEFGFCKIVDKRVELKCFNYCEMVVKCCAIFYSAMQIFCSPCSQLFHYSIKSQHGVTSTSGFIIVKESTLTTFRRQLRIHVPDG